MAIQTRGGNEVDFQPNKMLPREMAGVLDSKKVFYTFAPGDCRRLATHEEMTEMIDESVDIVKQDFTAGLTQAITDSETATATAIVSAQNADDKALLADEAKDRANTAAANAESIVLGDIATDTTVGVVKGGGDVKVDTLTGDMTVPDKLDKTGDASETTVEISEAEEDGEIITGTLSTILGLVKKKFAVMLTALAGKIDKASIVQSVEISDATKVPSSVITSWLASQISSLASSLTTLNNNLATQTVRGHGDCNAINGFTIPISANVAYRLDILTFVAVASTSASYLILGEVFIDAVFEGISPYAPRATMSGNVITVKLNTDSDIRNVRYILTKII